jgi:hypothetical protein
MINYELSYLSETIITKNLIDKKILKSKFKLKVLMKFQKFK